MTTLASRHALAVVVLSLASVLAAPAVAAAPKDRDGDGLSDRYERTRSKTSVTKVDTDRDKLSDSYEIRRSKTSPRRRDTDRDGLTDGAEVRTLRTNPRKPDTDGDQLSDSAEIFPLLNGLPAIGAEPAPQTNPRKGDTDGDGLKDGYEVRTSHTSPVLIDTDGDGLTDGDEVLVYRTNPVLPDTDSDGYNDLLEILQGSDPRDPKSPDAGGTPPPAPGDTTPPDTTITGGPSGTVSSSRASFSFSSSEAGVSYECSIDGAVWAVCTSSKRYSGLTDGMHTFNVRAIDGTRNIDPTPASRTWIVNTTPTPDTAPPETTISSGPTGTVSSAAASFGFNSSEAGSSYQCQVDGGAWGVCTSPKAYAGLLDGSHTFNVRAADAAGNVDATPAARTWTVDTTGPDTSLSSGPPDPSTVNSASFSFASPETGASYQCKLDGGTWAACASPKAYSGLANGSHTFNVRAMDAAGNPDLSPVSDVWTIIAPPDTTAPDTTISGGPSGSTTSTSASLSFTSTEADSTFECRIDAGAWGACSSPNAYSGLAVGSHTFDVRAIDGAGNTDASPASRAWTVTAPPADTTPPDTTISGGPSGTVTNGSASFSFDSTEAGSTFTCRMDGGAWGACTSPKAYAGLANGSHTFDVRATDSAGNVDASPASRTWTVNTGGGGGGTADVYLSPTGSDTAACTAGAPCRSLSRGYQVAQPGQTVELAAGSYGDTSLPVDSSKTLTTDVIMRPAAGATATLSAELHVNAKHVELRNLTFNGRLDFDTSADDVTIRDGSLSTFMMMSSGAQAPKNISIIGGEVGPSVNNNNLIASNGTSTTASPQNILIDDVDFHDFTLSSGSTAHVECLQVWSADGLTIRNSRFRNCEVFDIFLQKLPGGAAPTPRNILIENNFMDCCGSGFYAIRMGDHAGTSWSNVTIRNNSFNKAINPDPTATFSNVAIMGNIGPKVEFYAPSTGATTAQPAGVTTDYNVWYAGAKVGTHDKVAASGFVNPGAFDFHIGPTAPAVDAGNPANAPSTDIDGDIRPQGSAPDAGADETSGSPPPPDTTAPDTTISGGPSGSTTSTSASVSFTSTEAGSTFECRIDAGAWGACGSPKAYSGLAVGSHTFDVRATDGAGNTDASPASQPWTITPGGGGGRPAGS